MASQSSAHSYFVRLGKLSAQVQERALELSLIKASAARDATHRAVSQISGTLELLENLRGTNTTLTGAPEQLLKRWREWRQEGQEEQGQEHGAESTEEDGKENGEVQELVFITGFDIQHGRNLQYWNHLTLNPSFDCITHRAVCTLFKKKTWSNFVLNY